MFAFFTSPYALDIVEHIDPFVPAYKIGSGDITWLEIIEATPALCQRTLWRGE